MKHVKVTRNLTYVCDLVVKTSNISPNEKENIKIIEKMKFEGLSEISLIFEKEFDTKILICIQENFLDVVFAGLKTFDLTNEINLVKIETTRISILKKMLKIFEGNKFHKGADFAFCLVKDELLFKVRELLLTKQDLNGIRISGHSVGGVMATRAALNIGKLVKKINSKFSISLVTMGNPPMANDKFIENLTKIIDNGVILANNNDIYPNINAQTIGYQAISNKTTLYDLNSDDEIDAVDLDGINTIEKLKSTLKEWNIQDSTNAHQLESYCKRLKQRPN
ncbi:MAG: hypothetical protein OEZ01_09715 [Candidatus Heimdallarchaeota archaeon]|nr:hypothetical protein [Candidatus Heimdallarchaeota archaeon]MDH5646274.1 hypothetical protein [Candidatus Heimdallarchaeota archaeon]